MHLSDEQTAAFEGRMNMLQSKSPYDMQMSVASSSYSGMPAAAYSSMAAYTPQMAAPMHAMHHPMYSGKLTILGSFLLFCILLLCLI